LERAMNAKGPDSDTWQSYRRSRLVLLMMFLGWIPVMRVVNEVYTRFNLPLFVPVGAGIIWIIATGVQGLRIAAWPCPYCGKSFRGLLPFLPKKCWNCLHSR
jgi:hypothetical protein